MHASRGGGRRGGGGGDSCEAGWHKFSDNGNPRASLMWRSAGGSVCRTCEGGGSYPCLVLSASLCATSVLLSGFMCTEWVDGPYALSLLQYRHCIDSPESAPIWHSAQAVLCCSVRRPGRRCCLGFGRKGGNLALYSHKTYFLGSCSRAAMLNRGVRARRQAPPQATLRHSLLRR